jgi:hypothetical protein
MVHSKYYSTERFLPQLQNFQQNSLQKSKLIKFKHVIKQNFQLNQCVID